MLITALKLCINRLSTVDNSVIMLLISGKVNDNKGLGQYFTSD